MSRSWSTLAQAQRATQPTWSRTMDPVTFTTQDDETLRYIVAAQPCWLSSQHQFGVNTAQPGVNNWNDFYNASDSGVLKNKRQAIEQNLWIETRQDRTRGRRGRRLALRRKWSFWSACLKPPADRRSLNTGMTSSGSIRASQFFYFFSSQDLVVQILLKSVENSGVYCFVVFFQILEAPQKRSKIYLDTRRFVPVY